MNVRQAYSRRMAPNWSLSRVDLVDMARLPLHLSL